MSSKLFMSTAKPALAFVALMSMIVALLLFVERTRAVPPITPTQMAAVQSRLNKFCGHRDWTARRWFDAVVDDKGRTLVRVQVELSDAQRSDVTVVLLGDEVYALLVNPGGDASGVNDWLRITESRGKQ